MRISGEGNVAYARLPELTLADTLRAYQADTLVTRNQQKPEQATRCTTWVLQALSPGTYTLPALTFNFFNPVIHAYQQLRSTPITLKISPCKPNIQTTRRALSSCTSNMMRIAHIPRPLCAFLVMLAVCILIGAHIIPLYQETVIHAVRRRWRTYQLIRACTQKNAQRVYEQWFLWFSAQQEHATGHETLEELGTHTLQKQAQQESWCAYVHEIKTAAFSARNKKLNHTLCTQTRRWIRALEKAQ